MLGTYVLRLDWQRKEWLDVENLGKKMLFLGYNYSHSSMLVPVDDEVGELSEFSNTIHFDVFVIFIILASTKSSPRADFDFD